MNKNHKIKIIIVVIFSAIALPLIIYLNDDINTFNQIEQTIPIINAKVKQSNKINKPTEIKINLP